jgi:hypothetical protein
MGSSARCFASRIVECLANKGTPSNVLLKGTVLCCEQRNKEEGKNIRAVAIRARLFAWRKFPAGGRHWPAGASFPLHQPKKGLSEKKATARMSIASVCSGGLLFASLRDLGRV